MVWIPFLVNQIYNEKHAEARDRTGGLQILSLTLSQLSYRGCCSGFFYPQHNSWSARPKLADIRSMGLAIPFGDHAASSGNVAK